MNEVKTKDGRVLKLGWRVWKVDSDPHNPSNGKIIYVCGLDNSDNIVYKLKGINGEMEVLINDLDWFERFAKPAPKECDSFNWKPEPEIEFGSMWKSKEMGFAVVVVPTQSGIRYTFRDGSGNTIPKERFLWEFEPA